MTRIDAIRIIDTELERWGYSMTRLPKYLTLEQALRIVGPTVTRYSPTEPEAA